MVSRPVWVAWVNAVRLQMISLPLRPWGDIRWESGSADPAELTVLLGRGKHSEAGRGDDRGRRLGRPGLGGGSTILV